MVELHELTRLFEVIGYGKQTHGTLSDYLEIKGLIFAGRPREALNELLRSTKKVLETFLPDSHLYLRKLNYLQILMVKENL